MKLLIDILKTTVTVVTAVDAVIKIIDKTTDPKNKKK
jgi:hypothetical protein